MVSERGGDQRERGDQREGGGQREGGWSERGGWSVSTAIVQPTAQCTQIRLFWSTRDLSLTRLPHSCKHNSNTLESLATMPLYKGLL